MADFSLKPTLTGASVVLRPFRPGDVETLGEALRDTEVSRLTGTHTALADDVVRAWYATRNEQPDRLDLAIEDRGSGACVGEAVLNEWSPACRSCNVRILMTAPGRGRGLGTEATRLIVGYGFERLSLHRISLGVYAFNPRARRAYEKVGFVTEGVLRDALYWDGTWVDAIAMSMLAPEWPRLGPTDASVARG